MGQNLYIGACTWEVTWVLHGAWWGRCSAFKPRKGGHFFCGVVFGERLCVCLWLWVFFVCARGLKVACIWKLLCLNLVCLPWWCSGVLLCVWLCVQPSLCLWARFATVCTHQRINEQLLLWLIQTVCEHVLVWCIYIYRLLNRVACFLFFALPSLLEGARPLAGSGAGTISPWGQRIVRSNKAGSVWEQGEWANAPARARLRRNLVPLLLWVPGARAQGFGASLFQSLGGRLIAFIFYLIIRCVFHSGLVDRAEEQRDPDVRALSAPCLH